MRIFLAAALIFAQIIRPAAGARRIAVRARTAQTAAAPLPSVPPGNAAAPIRNAIIDKAAIDKCLTGYVLGLFYPLKKCLLRPEIAGNATPRYKDDALYIDMSGMDAADLARAFHGSVRSHYALAAECRAGGCDYIDATFDCAVRDGRIADSANAESAAIEIESDAPDIPDADCQELQFDDIWSETGPGCPAHAYADEECAADFIGKSYYFQNGEKIVDNRNLGGCASVGCRCPFSYEVRAGACVFRENHATSGRFRPTCGQRAEWYESYIKCLSPTRPQSSRYWDSEIGQCICQGPAFQKWNGETCACPNGAVLNDDKTECVCPALKMRIRNTDFWDTTGNYSCEDVPDCPAGSRPDLICSGNPQIDPGYCVSRGCRTE